MGKVWRFTIDYRKLDANVQYSHFRIPVTAGILSNIMTTNFMLTLDLPSGYFQIAMKPEDTAKTAFITSNGCFAFKRMSFGLSGTIKVSEGHGHDP